MPGFDGTGPTGQGPFSGRGMGFCLMPLGKNTSPYVGPRMNMSRAGYMGYPPYFPAKRFSVAKTGRNRGRKGMGRR